MKTPCVELDGGKYILFPLKNGGSGITDIKYKKIVEDAIWTWWPKKGITSYEKDQTILLQNMIAPFESVSFKNRHKWDCRIENLTNFRGVNGTPTRIGKNIYNNISTKKIMVHRKVILNKVKCVFQTGYSYKFKSINEAMEKAVQCRDYIFSMSKEEFIKWKEFRPSHKASYNHMIQDYDCFNGREISKSEMYQSGMSHVYDNRD